MSQSISQAARLARTAHALTICARGTYEQGTENVVAPQVLRAYNELLHRVTAAVGSHLAGDGSFSVEAIVEMMRTLGKDIIKLKKLSGPFSSHKSPHRSRVIGNWPNWTKPLPPRNP